MTTDSVTDVLVVGAGLGGLALAADLHAAGVHVRVLDKSRGVSGRAATRRLTLPDGRTASLDHGARFFTARGGRLRGLAEAGVREGWLRVWATGFPTWQSGTLHAGEDHYPRYVPPDGFSALGRHLAAGLDVVCGVTVTRLEGVAGGWRVHDAAGGVHRARRVVLNLPAPQAASLPGDLPLTLRAALEEVEYDPYWAVGAVLERDIDADWPALRLEDHPVLEWVAREHTKRPPGHPPALMLHARGDWSRDHLEEDARTIQEELLSAATGLLGPLPVLGTFAHRWRYAQPTRRVPPPHFWDADLGLGACGDGFTPDPHGTRVEAALLSGWSLASALRGEA